MTAIVDYRRAISSDTTVALPPELTVPRESNGCALSACRAPRWSRERAARTVARSPRRARRSRRSRA